MLRIIILISLFLTCSADVYLQDDIIYIEIPLGSRSFNISWVKIDGEEMMCIGISDIVNCYEKSNIQFDLLYDEILYKREINAKGDSFKVFALGLFVGVCATIVGLTCRRPMKKISYSSDV
ncbi:MAG: hypothetical protein MUO21_12145 [Nitrososphaeraceae archaeon]|nr:hypothetical protein [Nitrososphaeraceae archaeon]